MASRPGACAACSGGCEDGSLTAGHERARFPIRVLPDRDPARIILWLVLRLAVAEIALVIGLRTAGTIGIALTATGAVVLAYVILLALHVLTLRIEIRPREVRVASLLVRRRYSLEAGSVVRVRVDPKRGVFKTQLGGFGVELGAGQAEGEPVDVVRLAPIATALMLPTRPRRLAVVPSSESALKQAVRLAGGEPAAATPDPDPQPAVSRASR